MYTAIDETRVDLGGNIRFGDANTFCPQLWAYMIDRYSMRSMLDVGCGEGHAVSFFHKRGVHAHGIDGLMANVRRAVVPIAHHDLLAAPYVMPVDFVWSCEVAEHIAPDRVDNFIDTLCNGQIVAITHALPGQAGHHHVNCQPSAYWVALMDQRGYALDRSYETFRAIAASEHVANYFATSGLVFVRLR